MMIFNMDNSSLSHDQMLDIVTALAQEVYGTPITVMQDPVDNMWIIFNPAKKITYVVNPSLESLLQDFLEEYAGMLEVDHMNLDKDIPLSELN